MQDRHKIDIKNLEKRMTDLSDALAHLNNAEDWKRLILILHHPGFTTPAEFIFISSLVDSMRAQADALSKQQGALLKGCEAIIAK